jgi:Na+/melibiose symporter-like transporter
MSTQTDSRLPLLVATAGPAHGADQLALAALPLVAAVSLGLGPAELGTLVAIQTGAWLVASVPAGLLVDRIDRRLLAIASQAVAAVALVIATLAAALSAEPLLAAALFVAGAGIVTFALTSVAMVPDLVPAASFQRANARLETARALMMLAAPLIAGHLAQRGMGGAALGLAALAATLSALVATRLHASPPATGTTRPPLRRALRDGFACVAATPLLRGIVACALAWNFAWAALGAVFVLFALNRIGLDAASTGMALSAGGFGFLAGALAAPWLMARVTPNVILIGGPLLSLTAALLIAASPAPGGIMPPLIAFALLGFGPMLWLVMQTSLRQLVTPRDRMGSVNALIQTAIYGIRPVGALTGGLIAARFGLDAAILMVALCFALSLFAAVASPLGRLTAMPVRVG